MLWTLRLRSCRSSKVVFERWYGYITVYWLDRRISTGNRQLRTGNGPSGYRDRECISDNKLRLPLHHLSGFSDHYCIRPKLGITTDRRDKSILRAPEHPCKWHCLPNE